MKVAAIGYGAFGSFAIKALKELSDVQIIAVAGRDAKRVKSFVEETGIPKWTTD